MRNLFSYTAAASSLLFAYAVLEVVHDGADYWYWRAFAAGTAFIGSIVGLKASVWLTKE